ncbi:hypothetical protein L596_026951 [Steinernema carpocapsae]|uniref:NR LBD domain-containing protein n=1 Tax=Steinernema carpocapsae TaxID=34508 RepID=A0A4U5M2V6_STECR|nr:hypothetical protein L596_026951 [Steinernema carpocapsae]
MTLDSERPPREDYLPSLPSTSNYKLVEKMVNLEVDGHYFKCDMKAFMADVDAILDQKSHVDKTSLQRMIDAYRSMMPEGKINVKFVTKMHWKQGFINSHVQMKQVARWMMACQEFGDLPIGDKSKIFTQHWQKVSLLERSHHSMEYSKKIPKPECFLITDALAVPPFGPEYTGDPGYEDRTRIASEQFTQINKELWEKVHEPLRKMKMTEFEVVFLCFQRMWDVKNIEGLDPRTYEIAEIVLERMGAELHNRYNHELMMQSYACRLMKALELLSSLEEVFETVRRKMLLMDAFGVFKISLNEFW